MDEKEPSLLDYLKSIFACEPSRYQHYFKNSPIKNSETENTGTEEKKKSRKNNFRFPFFPLLAFVVALVAQFYLEPIRRNVITGILGYLVAAFLLFLYFWENRLISEKHSYEEKKLTFKISREIRIPFLFVATFFLAAAFWFFQDNRFTFLNVSLWLIGLILFVIAVWERKEEPHHPIKTIKKKIDIFFIFVVIVGIVSIFFRIYDLNEVPSEMFSDHAEKLLDVADVLDGKTSIFFERNTGREALQFYLTAAIIKLFHTGISFLSLKIGTVLAGLLTLPFIYLIGREVGGKWTGLASLFLAGVAYWPNVISRVALRYAFYPLFTATTFYFLIKGFRTQKRNDFLLAGLSLGLGLHGYSSARILPLVVSAVFLVYFLFLKKKQERRELIWVYILVALAAFFVFLPLFRYIIENPAMFSYRATSRLLPVEQKYPGNPILIFLTNFWKAMTMFFYDNGVIWVHSIPNRPALDIVSAALYFIGTSFAIVESIRKKNWLMIAILISIPLLLMPSILSLAFPSENPCLNRTGGAYVLTFVLAGYGWVQIANYFSGGQRNKERTLLLIGITLCCVFICSFQNYALVFRQYRQEYDLNAWNTSEIAKEIKRFSQNGGELGDAFVVPYPYWVDTRLVGINLGLPRKDYAIWPEDFAKIKQTAGAYLFIIKPEDSADLSLLQAMFPNSSLVTYQSKIPGKNFIEFFVQN